MPTTSAKSVTLSTGLDTPTNTNLLALMATSDAVTDPELIQISGTNTSTGSQTLILPNASPTELRILNVQGNTIDYTFDYNAGDTLTINPEVSGPAVVNYQIQIHPTLSTTPILVNLSQIIGPVDTITLNFTQKKFRKSGKFQVFVSNNSPVLTNQIFDMNITTT